ncbi:hypothetical protein [Cerasicoccus fimbriatus]|uniref:hypothetical protein n=1 Tax=Cerasicoccus fimbriatus TaxID=3014554 RepID=UPI0022B33215|nr:hypothetical protein [Cerasicoccus sp. TK19100]
MTQQNRWLTLFTPALFVVQVSGQTALENFDSLTLASSIGNQSEWSLVEGSAVISGTEFYSGSQSVAVGASNPLSEVARVVQGSEWGSGTVAWWDFWILPMAHVEGAELYSITADGSQIEFRAAQIEFRSGDLLSYSSVQDGQFGHPTLATISGGGSTIQLQGNSWKAMPHAYTITPSTVLSFELKVENAGELIMIAMDDNLAYTDATLFKLAGSQSGPYISDYPYSDSDFQSFTIPIGQYYTGEKSYLALLADDDANGLADATFRNVKLHEGGMPANEHGMVIVNDGGSNRVALPTYFATTSNASDSWMRVTMRQDFSSGIWDLYVNGEAVPVAADIMLSGSHSEPTQISLLGDQVGAVYLDDVQLKAISPIFTDNDNDGMDDAWEVLFAGLSTSLNDRDGDADLDTLSNLEEYMGNTSPDDYYNDSAPTLTKLSGNQQVAYPGIWLEEPLIVNVQDGMAQDLENAPIDWAFGGGLNLLGYEKFDASPVALMELITNDDGESAVYAKAPNSLGNFSITATAPYGDASQVQQTYTMQVTPLRFVYDAEDADPSDDLLNDEMPTVEEGNNVYLRSGQMTLLSSDYIPIDPSKEYRLSGLFRSVGAQDSKIFYGYACYYKNEQGAYVRIAPEYVNRTGDAANIESYDSNTGTLDLDIAPTGWNTTGGHNRWLAYYIGGDTSKLPDIVQKGVSNGETFDNVTNDVLTYASGVTPPNAVLNALSASQTVTVMNQFSGSGYSYAAASNTLTPNIWTEHKAESITGMSWGTHPYTEFRQGAEYVKVMILANYGQSSSEVLHVDDLIFEEITDFDGDSIPDWWEWRIIHHNDADSFVGLGDIGIASDFDGDGLNDAQEHVSGNDPLVADYVAGATGVFYINNMIGSDTACNGLSATRGLPSAGDGPYRSLGKAVESASTGDSLVIYETRNDYEESILSLSGKDMVLRPVGTVVIR